jgi:hypothetical protein
VIVSAQRGQYSKPGSHGPGFFFAPKRQVFHRAVFSDRDFHDEKDRRPLTVELAHRIISLMITNPCAFAVMKKASLSGTWDWRAR